MGSEQEAREAVELYGDTVRRICMLHLKSYHDTEDIFQTVFLKYMLHTGGFQDREHEKAWIIRTAANACKDLLKSHWRRTTVAMDEASPVPAPPVDEGSLLAAVQLLPPKYRAVIYLYYYEGYAAKEIARLLGENPATISTRLNRGRARLRTLLEQEELA